MTEAITTTAITEDWLRSAGFKWHEEHQYLRVPAIAPAKLTAPRKHWLLWFGSIANTEPDGRRRMFCGDEDLGIELCQGNDECSWWHCWLRADISHRYSRFLHIRHVRMQHEVIAMVIALSGQPWQPGNHIYGRICSAEEAEHIRDRDQRLDVVIAKGNPWYESEKDEHSSPADITDMRINREKDGYA